jgi:hypothetical protein
MGWSKAFYKPNTQTSLYVARFPLEDYQCAKCLLLERFLAQKQIPPCFRKLTKTGKLASIDLAYRAIRLALRRKIHSGA